MMIFCDKENIKVYANRKPTVMVRATLPSMTDAEIADILKKPFVNTLDVTYTIIYNSEEYRIFVPRQYTYDGATIPLGFRWLLGAKGSPNFLIASCVHDKLCECKWLIDYDRELSSLIFKELLLACGCPNWKANLMHFAVNNFQKLCQGWK